MLTIKNLITVGILFNNWFRYAGAPIDFEKVDFNSETTDPSCMENALLSVRRNGVAIKGTF